MEQLKPIAELAKPDVRQTYFVVRNEQNAELRPVTLEDVYQRAASIRLHDGVPEVIRSHFATALNLIAYSWFYYPFNVTAQLLAYVSVESALKIRYGNDEPSFKRLVRRAVEDGLIRDEGFSRVRSFQGKTTEPTSDSAAQTEQQLRPYVDGLVDSMPMLRNSLAHGEYMIHMHGPSHVRICAEFINQLFAVPDPE